MKHKKFFVIVGFMLTMSAWGASEDGNRIEGVFTEASAIESASAQAEKNWPKDIKAYSLGYRDLIKRTTVYIGRQPNAASVRVLEDVTKRLLEKTELEPSAGCDFLICIQAEALESLLNAARSPNFSTQDRLRLGGDAIVFYKAFKNRIIVNATPKPSSANVIPPSGAGFAGMDPQGIADPVDRAKYVEALRVNAVNENFNIQQVALEVSMPRIRDAIIALLKDTGKRDPMTEDQIGAMLLRMKEIGKGQH